MVKIAIIKYDDDNDDKDDNDGDSEAFWWNSPGLPSGFKWPWRCRLKAVSKTHRSDPTMNRYPWNSIFSIHICYDVECLILDE